MSTIDEGKFLASLNFFQALADKNRLRIINLLREREYNVGELAAQLGLKEPTISHHLSKLHPTGVVNRRIDGNQHFYRLNEGQIRRIGQQIANLDWLTFEIEDVTNDTAWIDDLEDFDEEERKVLKDYTINGRLKHIPTKQLKLMVVLRWLETKFELGRTYTEKEVNAILGQYHEDYARLRRELVDTGYLRRERGGSKYWLAPEDEDIHSID